MALARAISRFSLACFGGLLGLAAAEGVLRLWTPRHLEFGEHAQSWGEQSAMHPRARNFELDAELGYRPLFGGRMFDARGVKPNGYPDEKPDGARRVLFLGDSVTYRGEIVEGIRLAFGDEGIEYWNAGVEGYSTRQEMRYYERHLMGLGADHLVLTFHMNDFTGTPVTFMDGDQMVVVKLSREVERPDPFWMRHSRLYRLAQRLALIQVPSPEGRASVVAEIERSLARLKELAAARGARLTVLFFPTLDPLAAWPEWMKHDRATALELFRAQGLALYDLLEPLEAALAAGMTVRVRPADPRHPSAEFGRFAGEWLRRNGFTP